MYSANQFEYNILKVSQEKIKDSLIKLTDTVNNINRIILEILGKNENYDDDFQKIKLISFNVSGKCEEIYKTIEKNFSSENQLENDLFEQAENLKQISKNINQDVSIKILKATNQSFNFEQYTKELEEKRTLEKKRREDEIKEVENTLNESCLGIIIIFFVVLFLFFGFGIE